MKRALITLAVAVVVLAGLPLAAQTGTWTAVASTGTVDESAFGIYAFGSTNLGYLGGSASVNPIVARYNVTNTYGGGLTDTPPWSILELGYFDNSPVGAVRADLFRVDPCTGKQTLLCTVTSTDNPQATCDRCGFTAGVNFGTNLYYVQVTLTRTTPNAMPQAFTLRIF
jgi:hypothetical protein